MYVEHELVYSSLYTSQNIPDELLKVVSSQANVIVTWNTNAMSENVTQIHESRALVVVKIEVLTENVSNRGVPPCTKKI